MVKKGILLVSFGTAAAEAWDKTLGLLAGEVRESFPDVPVYEAITSPTGSRVMRVVPETMPAGLPLASTSTT